MRRNKVEKGGDFLPNMPGWLFWGFLLCLTWWFSITKIASLDIWWHLACGRFYVENGFYPPPGTFTFSPVNPVTANIRTWFGDIVLYLVYLAGGEFGLQGFRFVLTLVPVFALVLVARKKYSFWLLALSALTVIGTIQVQLLRNSMYALFFLPLIVWIWWYINQRKDLKSYCLVFIFAPIIWIWSIMHGYALVGTYVVLLIFAGEVMDLFIRKSPRKWIKTAIFSGAVVCMVVAVNANLSLDLGSTVSSFIGMVTQQTTQERDTVESKETSQSRPEKEGKRPSQKWIDVVKQKTRFLMKGGDVGFIGEYESPFDNTGLIYIKALFIFVCVYLFYLGASAVLFFKHFRLSFLLPSMAVVFIGMGYVRTTAFPFLVAGPFMVAGIMDTLQFPWKEKSGKVRIVEAFKTKYLEAVPLALLSVFFLMTCYYFFTGNYIRLTGIVGFSPGIGRADRHMTKVPQYVLQKYPDENMYNTYNVGSLLIWEWYGKKKVFIDGRSSTYQQKFYDDFRYNYSFGALQEMDLRHALIGISDDYQWFEGYLRRNWDIECFDTGMVLLTRRVKEGYDNFYGNIPKFIGQAEDVGRMTPNAQVRLARFLNEAFKYMLIFGRLEDSSRFYSDIENLIHRLPAFQQRGRFYKELMEEVKNEFGGRNNTALVELFKELLLTTEQDRQDAFMNWDRNMATIYVAFANAHFRLGNRKKGVEFLSAAADTEKDDIDLQILVADHFYKMRALGPAIKYYERVLGLDPQRVHEHNKLGTLYFQKGDVAKAQENFEQAVKSDPQIIASYINLAACLLSQGKFQEALEVDLQGLKVDPDNPDLLGIKKEIESQ